MDIQSFNALFKQAKPLIGMVHLKALPGSPQSLLSVAEVMEAAVEDAAALLGGGIDGLMLENYGDVPFTGSQVGPETVSAMTLIADEIRSICSKPMGINVLRNDSRAALAIASVLKCDFIRVNVYMGVVATDQGLIEGKAFETLRYRALLKSPVKIFADVFVKHGHTMHQSDIGSAAIDGVARGLADGIIVTGGATGQPVNLDELNSVKTSIRNTPLLAGSGVTCQSLPRLLAVADGFIVGTSLKADGQTNSPVDQEKVKKMISVRDEWLACQSE